MTDKRWEGEWILKGVFFIFSILMIFLCLPSEALEARQHEGVNMRVSTEFIRKKLYEKRADRALPEL
jgi:hypothetical protein